MWIWFWNKKKHPNYTLQLKASLVTSYAVPKGTVAKTLIGYYLHIVLNGTKLATKENTEKRIQYNRMMHNSERN